MTVKIYAHRTNKLGNDIVLPIQDLIKDFVLPDNHEELFRNHKEILSKIPENERINLHYELAINELEQEIIPIDIDKIEGLKEKYLSNKSEFTKECLRYLNVVATHFQLDPKKLGVVFSGNGLHILIKTDYVFKVKDIPEMRDTLKGVCSELNYTLAMENLSGYVDVLPFRPRGTLRLPGTINKKINKDGESFSVCELLQLPIKQTTDLSTLKQPVPSEQYRKPDTKAVLQGCSFLTYCRENPTLVSRPQWFFMMGVLRHLENGEELVHSYSALDPARYNESVTNRNLKDWNDSGPPYCTTIAKNYKGCLSCPHYEKCSTPLTLKSEESKINEAKSHGFRELIITKEGTKKGKVLYDELVDHFVLTQGIYIVMEGSNDVYAYNGTHYQLRDPQRIKAWAKGEIADSTSKHADEFYKILILKDDRFVLRKDFTEQMVGKVNFKNGVLFTETGDFVKHSPDFYFTSVLPIMYSKEAKAPLFERFMDEITSNDQQMKNVLLEYFGMTLANAPAMIVQKALILTGDGNTGKSSLLNIMTELFGRDNVSGVKVKDFGNPTYLNSMVGKVANIVYEMGPNELRNCEQEFKEIVGGDSVFCRQLYRNGESININAKVMIACNKMPPVDDSTRGVFRRIIIVPFMNSFSKDKGNLDRNIVKRIASTEIAGIANILIDQWLKFKKNEFEFSESKTLDNELKTFKQLNPIINFCEDYLNFDDNDEIGTKVKDVYDHYHKYCRETGRVAKNRGQFIQDIMEQVAATFSIPKSTIEYKEPRNRIKYLKYVQLFNEEQDRF